MEALGMRQFYYIFFRVSKSNQIFPGVSTHFMIVYPISNYLWLPWKWKMENSTEMETTRRVEQGYIPNTTSYLELFMNTIKIKDFCNRYQYEMQKAGMEEGIMPIKSLRAGWRRDTFQTQYPMWNCSWIPWK